MGKQLIKSMSFITDIKFILTNARQKAYSAVNSAMVEAYWLVGKRIVEEEQNGKKRAAYGEEILKTLSVELTKEFGKGFGTRNLWDFKKFYLIFNEHSIVHTLCAQLFRDGVALIALTKVDTKKKQLRP